MLHCSAAALSPSSFQYCLSGEGGVCGVCQQQQREHSPAAPQDEDKEVESEESNVELDMEGIVKKPNPEEAHEMVSVWN